jgi:cytochrome c553
MRVRLITFLFVTMLAVLSGSEMLLWSAGNDPKAGRSAQKDPGERIFETQCSRCHFAPQTLSPAAARTVLRHMRVRANLTAEQERQLLQFMAPYSLNLNPLTY